MNCVFSLNSPKDTSLAQLLVKTSPIPIKILLTNFSAIDQFGWKKPKRLMPNFLEEDIRSVKKVLGDDMIVCNNESQFLEELKKTDLFLTRGRELCILKSPSKNNIALSFDRAYLSRFFDIMPHYDNLKIMLYTPKWLDKDTMGIYGMGGDLYDNIEQHKDRFIFGNVLGKYYDMMVETGKDEIKSELNLPLDKKIAFFSFRKASEGVSIHDNKKMFFDESIRMLKEFKDRGYYIISRRKMYKTLDNPLDMSQCPELKKYIDVEMNGHGGYPDLIWRALFASDVLISSDLTGLLFFEGLLARCPVYMPYRDIPHVIEKIKKLPPVWEMIKNELVLTEYNDKSVNKYHDSVEQFIETWHGGGINDFWETILKNCKD